MLLAADSTAAVDSVPTSLQSKKNEQHEVSGGVLTSADLSGTVILLNRMLALKTGVQHIPPASRLFSTPLILITVIGSVGASPGCV